MLFNEYNNKPFRMSFESSRRFLFALERCMCLHSRIKLLLLGKQLYRMDSSQIAHRMQLSHIAWFPCGNISGTCKLLETFCIIELRSFHIAQRHSETWNGVSWQSFFFAPRITSTPKISPEWMRYGSLARKQAVTCCNSFSTSMNRRKFVVTFCCTRSDDMETWNEIYVSAAVRLGARLTSASSLSSSPSFYYSSLFVGFTLRSDDNFIASASMCSLDVRILRRMRQCALVRCSLVSLHSTTNYDVVTLLNPIIRIIKHCEV